MPRKPKKYTKKKRSNLNKKIYRIAKKVATNVNVQLADPLWSHLQLGTYTDLTGQYSQPQEVAPGPNNGMIFEFPRISQPQNLQDLGNPSTRADTMILINGIKLRLRFTIPPNIETAFINVYLYYCEDDSATARMFPCPDQTTMVRALNQNWKEAKEKLKILETRKIYINANDKNTCPVKDVNIYYKPKRPWKFEFSGPQFTDWLNGRFGFAVLASYQYALNPLPAEDVSFVGSVITYYRDT